MVTMDTKSKIRRLRRLFEPAGNNPSVVNGASQSLDRKGHKSVGALHVRSCGQSDDKITTDPSKSSKLISFGELRNKLKTSKQQVKLVRKGGVRLKPKEGPYPLHRDLTFEPESPTWDVTDFIDRAAGIPFSTGINKKLCKSTGQLNFDLAHEQQHQPVAKKSLSQNPLRTAGEVEERIYAVPCNTPVQKEEGKDRTEAAEYENTRKPYFKSNRRRVMSYVRLFETSDSTDGPDPRSRNQARYKRPVDSDSQGSLDRTASRSLPDLAFPDRGVKIIHANGLFATLNKSTSTPNKPSVPRKITLPAVTGDKENLESIPPLETGSNSSSSTTANIFATNDGISRVDNLKARFEEPQPKPYPKPKISPKPVSQFPQNEYQIPGQITPLPDRGPVYEIPGNHSNSFSPEPHQDPLGGSGSEDKLKKIFGVLSLERDILAKDNNIQNPKKAKTPSKKKKPKDNFYAVTQLPTGNTNPNLKNRKMDETEPFPPQGGQSQHGSSSLSADSGTSHTFPEPFVSPHTSGRTPSSQDPNQRDSDFIDGPEEFEEPGQRVSDSDFESEEEGSKVKAPEPSAFNNNSHKVAYELLTSERTYVEKLHLLSAIFQVKITAENKKQKWFSEDVIKQIFSNIKSIYDFHHTAFLPILEIRLLEWDRKPCIGDILRKNSPFLKMYAEYISNFDKAMSQLSTWKTKQSKFANALSDIVKNEKACNGLALEHHMLEPVQRIPRYELLLKEYLKKLPDDSQDKEDSLEALKVISQAAEHSNNRMKVMDLIDNLFKLNACIEGMDIIDPSRKLLKEGKLDKLGTRNDPQERYIFLFNDMLLCCVHKRTSKLVNVSKSNNKVYKFKERIDVDNMQVLDSDNQRFQVEAGGITREFQAASEEDKEDWLQALLGAVREHIRKKDTFKNNIADAFEISFEDQLGKQPPTYIKDEEVTMCMRCGADFDRVMKRRHHCRACGYVICGKCSCNQIELPYDDNKPNRVCTRCFQKLAKQPVMDDLTRRSFVPNLDETLHYATSLYLLQKNSWNKYWVAATQQDLFALKAPRDVRAVLTLPVKLYEVKEICAKDGVPVDKEYVFKLEHGQTAYFFAADSYKIKSSWMKILSDGLEESDEQNSESTTL